MLLDIEVREGSPAHSMAWEHGKGNHARQRDKGKAPAVGASEADAQVMAKGLVWLV